MTRFIKLAIAICLLGVVGGCGKKQDLSGTYVGAEHMTAREEKVFSESGLPKDTIEKTERAITDSRRSLTLDSEGTVTRTDTNIHGTVSKTGTWAVQDGKVRITISGTGRDEMWTPSADGKTLSDPHWTLVKQ